MAEPDSLFASRQADFYALPVAFGSGWLLNQVGFGVVMMFFYHEFGHALVGWLAGRWAFAIPIAGLTFVGDEFSLFVACAAAAAWFFLARYAWREDRHGLLLASSSLLLGQAFLSLVADKRTADMWILYGGSAGELLLSGAIIASFYYRLSERLRWDFWRYPLLLTAACMFLQSSEFWYSVRLDPENEMMGERLSSSRESDADWVKLVSEHGWTSRGIADSYLSLSSAIGIAIAAHYLWFLVLPRREQAAPHEASAQACNLD